MMRGPTLVARCATAADVMLPKWRCYEVGEPKTHAWRMFFTSGSPSGSSSTPTTTAVSGSNGETPTTGFYSAWHDLTLHPSLDPSIVTFVCEVPKGTRAKIELLKNEPFNPLGQDIYEKKEGKPLRFYTYGDILFNYGFAPQTWEDPSVVDSVTKCTGDGDPIDIVDVSGAPLPTGSVCAARVLGVLALIDQGETDWKIIVEALRPGGEVYGSLEKVPRDMKNAIVRWMRDYKTADGKKPNELAFNGEIRGTEEALDAIHSCSCQYSALMAGTSHNHGYWLR